MSNTDYKLGVSDERARILRRVRDTYKPSPPSFYMWRPGERDRLEQWNHAVRSIERFIEKSL